MFQGLIDPEGKGLGFTTSFLLAGFSGAVGAVVGSPPDLVLVRMQSDIRLPKEQRRQYRNGVHGIYRVFVEEGFSKLFYGVEWNAGVNTILPKKRIMNIFSYFCTEKGILANLLVNILLSLS